MCGGGGADESGKRGCTPEEECSRIVEGAGEAIKDEQKSEI